VTVPFHVISEISEPNFRIFDGWEGEVSEDHKLFRKNEILFYFKAINSLIILLTRIIYYFCFADTMVG
jgi:hypothetical protein